MTRPGAERSSVTVPPSSQFEAQTEAPTSAVPRVDSWRPHGWQTNRQAHQRTSRAFRTPSGSEHGQSMGSTHQPEQPAATSPTVRGCLRVGVLRARRRPGSPYRSPADETTRHHGRTPLRQESRAHIGHTSTCLTHLTGETDPTWPGYPPARTGAGVGGASGPRRSAWCAPPICGIPRRPTNPSVRACWLVWAARLPGCQLPLTRVEQFPGAQDGREAGPLPEVVPRLVEL
jgi:hypothetical protein